MDILKVVLCTCASIIIGSIPWSLIISIFLFKKDLRKHGTGELDSINILKVLGFRTYAIISLLDLLKTLITMMLCNFIAPNIVPYIGLAACVGHFFSIFTNFKSGKTAASVIGYMLGLSLFVTHDVIFTFAYPILFFLIILGLTKYMSLASISFMLVSTIIAWLTFNNLLYSLLVTLLTVLTIYIYRINIVKLINGKENKISFLA